MTACFVYMTAADKDEALRIGRVLVEERLVACVNQLDGMTSLYWWKGKVEEGCEVVLIAKTQPALLEKIIDRVRSLHSYECPCVISWPIEQGNPEYLKWIADETSAE